MGLLWIWTFIGDPAELATWNEILREQKKLRQRLLTGAPNDRFLGNDLKWLVMHPVVL